MTRPSLPKVSIIVSDLSSSGAARWGGGIRPFLLAQALQTLGCEVEMLGLAYTTEPPRKFDANFPVTIIPCGYHSGFISAVRQLLKLISGDILYAVKVKTSSFGIGLLKKYLSHRPLLLDIDDWELSWFGGENWNYPLKIRGLFKDVFTAEGNLRHPDHPLYLKWLEKRVLQADIITTHNQFLQNRFGGIYIPNGKDTHLFDPAAYDPQQSRKKHGLDQYRVLMFPGAPRPYKGLEDVLLALEQLNQPDLRLVIVGGSPYDDYDQALRQRWGKWMIYLPKSPVKLMPEIVAAAHIIVVPQRDTRASQAQFPLKLTDGMAMAKPVIAATVGDIPTILEDTGYLVPPGCPEQIAQQITHIFTQPEQALQQGKRARLRCQKHYEIQTMAATLANIIEGLSE